MEPVHDVALVDDHHLVRNGLAGIVNSMGGYRVSMEAANGRELIELLRDKAAPALTIVDLNMPVMDGYQTIAWLREHRPDIRCLALTFDAGDDALVRAMRAGARGFVLKTVRPAVLKHALDSLINTGYYLSEEGHETLRSNPEFRTREERERERLRAEITVREKEFLRLVCSEKEPTYEEIAHAMGVHRRTVDGYRESLFTKFNLRSKTGLVLFAMRCGVMEE
jgi:two-component system, NarL family, invasion response regulator UvrY